MEQGSGHVLLPDRLYAGGLALGARASWTRTHSSEEIERDRQRHVGAGIDGRRGARLGVAQIVGHERCGKGTKVTKSRSSPFRKKKPVVDAMDVAEHLVMVDPHDEDRREAGEVGEKRRPLPGERGEEARGRGGGLGTFRSRTRSVTAIAEDSSLKASTRPVSAPAVSAAAASVIEAKRFEDFLRVRVRFDFRQTAAICLSSTR